MGVASGCGFKEVYRFPHTTYPYSSCICCFLQQHPFFLFIFLMLFVLYIFFIYGDVGEKWIFVICGLHCAIYMYASTLCLHNSLLTFTIHGLYGVKSAK